jgi:hypothetical protein
MQDTGCRMQDAGCKPGVRVFRWPGSVFGARCSALGVDSALVPGTRSQVPDSRYPIPGTRYLAPVFEKPAHGVCKMQDADPTGAFSGTRLGPRYPAFGYGGMRGEGRCDLPSPRLGTEGRTPNPVPVTWHRGPETRYLNRRRGPSIRDPIRFYPASCILHLASCIPHPALSLI